MISLGRALLYLACVTVGGFVYGRLYARRPIHPLHWRYRIPFPRLHARFYRFLRIRHWQSRLPDISRLLPRIVPRKSLQSVRSAQDIAILLRENCVAESVHHLCLLAGCLCPLLIPGTASSLLGTLYALSNLPFILVQRYNRPRLVQLYTKALRLEGFDAF